MKRTPLVLATLVLLVNGVGQAKSGTVTLGFNSLPSAQGWTFTTAGQNYFTEANTFSVDGTTLHQNTIQYVNQTEIQGVAYYQYFTPINTSDPFSMDVTARVTASSPTSSTRDFGFFFGLVTNGEDTSIGLSSTAIQSVNQLDQASVPFDNTTYHDFRLTGTPGGSYQLSVDNIPVLTGTAVFTGESGSFLEFGDGTNAQNATADITSFTFSQSPASATPEPATLALLGIGIAGMAGYQWRRKRAVA